MNRFIKSAKFLAYLIIIANKIYKSNSIVIDYLNLSNQLLSINSNYYLALNLLKNVYIIIFCCYGNK